MKNRGLSVEARWMTSEPSSLHDILGQLRQLGIWDLAYHPAHGPEAKGRAQPGSTHDAQRGPSLRAPRRRQ
jgi:hypothetical protein